MTVLQARPGTARLTRRGATAYADHTAAHGPLPLPDRVGPAWQQWLLSAVERSGLTGRGGAGFPSATKMRLAASAAGPVLLVNAMEGEPASSKDHYLLAVAPHLVLDGADLVAAAIGASRVIFCIPNDRRSAAAMVAAALADRRELAAAPCQPELALLEPRFVAGEESALAAAAAGKLGIPSFRPDKGVPLRFGRGAALVHNPETLAHTALIARRGPEWFRQLGADEVPGTCLVTISGAVARPGVAEVETGTPVRAIIDIAGTCDAVQAVLVGGYGGSWLGGNSLDVPYAPTPLRACGAVMGAGVFIALAPRACGWRETERVARFLAAESAGQCGPCVFGLPAIAADLGLIADGRADREVLDRLLARCDQVAGRGACRHPDGAARLVRSALVAFGADLRSHLSGAPCPGSRLLALGTLPNARHEASRS
ncbi:MAG TPA: NADH-ubiquinone oxidoreductase-F iron-sulfur binding region domain-containing protein [Acidimicrobiales bacterium]|nr:NADH-ubiquinone oxidoreductase-F iron-sulfur binding region domain-containing protein [Acidimicrobiales bacterium]